MNIICVIDIVIIWVSGRLNSFLNPGDPLCISLGFMMKILKEMGIPDHLTIFEVLRRVPSLSWKDPLEEGMATHSSILTWRIPWKDGPDGLQSTGSQRVRHDWATNTFTFKNFTYLDKIKCCREETESEAYTGKATSLFKKYDLPWWQETFVLRG